MAALPFAGRAAAYAGDAAAGGWTTLTGRTGRDIHVASWKPAEMRGTILFSHGFASAPRHYMRMIDRWVASGWAVHAPLHVDSTEHPDTAQYKGMAGWAARMEDMSALSDWHGGDHVAMGHSFGGLTALAMGGATTFLPDGVERQLSDPNTRAVVAFSPPGPMPPLIDKAGYGTVRVPALIQTGDRDVLPGSDDPQSWRAHLSAFWAGQPSGDRFGLVLDGVDHYFGGLICDPDKVGPNQATQLESAIDASLSFAEQLSSQTPAQFSASPTARFYRR